MKLIVEEELDFISSADYAADVVRARRNDIPDLVLRGLERGEKIIAVYRGAWREYYGIVERARSMGLNWLLYHPIDSAELELARGALAPRDLVAAKLAWAMASNAARAHRRPSPDKKVSRRSLLRRPLQSLMDYYPAPILASPEACAVQRHCSLCLDACPYDALTGKPPRVNLDACTGCGLCTWSCPYSLLWMPSSNIDAFNYMLDVASSRSKGPMYLLVACRSDLPELIDAIANAEPHPLIFYDVECPSWLTEAHVVSAVARGFHVVPYCSRSRAEECGSSKTPVVEGVPVEPLVGSIDELLDIIRRPPRAVRLEGEIPESKVALTRMVMEAYGVKRAKLESPLTGIVYVDPDKCMLCDACSAMCPYGALELRVRDNKIQLVFRHGRCEACHACVAACPHDAIRLEYGYHSLIFEGEVLLAEDEVARCRRCGAPLGSMKMMKYLEEKLRSQGVSQWILDQLWLCPKCKIYGIPKD